MFGAFLNFLMAPVNFVRKTFGWLPDEADGDVSDAPELLEATVANGGPSASTFSAMQEAVYGNGINGSQTSTTTTATDFAGLSIYIPDVITAEDWQTLSMAQIDAKLEANGERAIGDPVGDPFYDLTPLEVAELTDTEFQALLDQADWGLDAPVWDGLITDNDWSTLSMAQIDAKLEGDGYEPIGDPDGDPFYQMSPAEIDALSDAEYFATTGAFGWDALYFPAWDGVLLPSDLSILSPAEVDIQLTEAGYETVGFAESPFYNLTPEDLQLLPDSALAQLVEDEQDAYTAAGYDITGAGVAGVVVADAEVIDSGTSTATDDMSWLIS